MRVPAVLAVASCLSFAPAGFAQPGPDDVRVSWPYGPTWSATDLTVSGTVRFANGWTGRGDKVTVNIYPAAGGVVRTYHARIVNGAWRVQAPLADFAGPEDYVIIPSVRTKPTRTTPAIMVTAKTRTVVLP